MMATLAAGAAVARPTAIAALPPSAPESPELLALGAELAAKLQAYRLAAARLAKARAVAAELWPPVPDELVVITRADRDFYAECYERETDCDENEVWPEPYQVNGQWFGHFPRNVLRSISLRHVLTEIRADRMLSNLRWKAG